MLNKIILLSMTFLSSIALSNDDYLIIDNKGFRADGAPSLLVLIDPINLKEKDALKNTVDKVLVSLKKKYSPKFSARIFDDKKAINYYIKLTKSSITKSEDDFMAVHLLASYIGDVSSMPWKYTTSYFPGTFTDNPSVGQHVHHQIYDSSCVEAAEFTSYIACQLAGDEEPVEN